MSKDRKAKARAIGAAVGVATAIATGVGVTLALTLCGAPSKPADSVIYPSDMHSGMPPHMEDMGEPPAP